MLIYTFNSILTHWLCLHFTLSSVLSREGVRISNWCSLLPIVFGLLGFRASGFLCFWVFWFLGTWGIWGQFYDINIPRLPLHYDLSREKIILGFLVYKLHNANWNAKQSDFFKLSKKFLIKILIYIAKLMWLHLILSEITV